tara:strand:- start:284 stop:727 length:444 start_codon:yes stop_codon:yes gene_type:complete
MTDKANNSNEDEINSLKEELDSLKKKKEINKLKEEVKSLKTKEVSSEVPNINGELTPAEIDEFKSKRTSVGILGIIFGWLGVHKFMLGYTTEGFILLAISIIGGIITCGFSIIITDIIGIIEGIMILNKTPKQFKETYVDKKTKWFQ